MSAIALGAGGPAVSALDAPLDAADLERIEAAAPADAVRGSRRPDRRTAMPDGERRRARPWRQS
jgi:hypothetical protein